MCCDDETLPVDQCDIYTHFLLAFTVSRAVCAGWRETTI